MISGTCSICGCSHFHPCMGGVVLPATNVHRMVADEELLGPGDCCYWLDVDNTVCSAHTQDELQAAGLELLPAGPLPGHEFEAGT